MNHVKLALGAGCTLQHEHVPLGNLLCRKITESSPHAEAFWILVHFFSQTKTVVGKCPSRASGSCLVPRPMQHAHTNNLRTRKHVYSQGASCRNDARAHTNNLRTQKHVVRQLLGAMAREHLEVHDFPKQQSNQTYNCLLYTSPSPRDS